MTTPKINFNSDKSKKYPLYLEYACVLAALISLVFILYVLRDTIVPLAFAALFSILLHPLCALFEKWRIPRILAIVLSIILLFAVVVGIVYLAALQIGAFAEEIPTITKKAENFLERVLAWGEEYLNVSRTQQISEGKRYLLNLLGESRNVLLNTLVSTGGTLGTAALIPLYVFFFLLYRDFFRLFVYKAFQTVSKSRLDVILKKIYDVIKSYLSGLVLVIGVVGILNTIGLLLLGVDYAFFFGFLAAFLILIPYIGILIGSLLPAMFSLVSSDSPWTAVGVIGVMSFVQFLEGNFITPNIVGSKVSVNPLAAIVMLLLGGQLWGLAGLILALPFTAILKVILDSHPRLEPFGFLLGEPGKEVREEEEKSHKLLTEQPARKKRYNRNRKKTPRPDAAGNDTAGAPPKE